ncbi:riboflavin transporter 2-like [Pieris rapae]|uniref:riboflavin transporter 2-like n=1 Tax=Pieris rapae TaxID=64459 RepID=UPI001E27B61E|nr:riboflavin transporter 2-like [Pieris rapae]
MFMFGRRVSLDLALLIWGWGSWLGVNGIFVQLPQLVQRLPEQWALGSSVTVAVQIANSGILIYAFVMRFLPKITDAMFIYGLLTVGTTALFLNAFLYTETAYVGATERSVTFIVLTIFTAMVGTTSSVVFYPYMRNFREMYLSTYLVGEGFGGLLPAILSLIQGIGGPPECRLSPDGNSMEAIYPSARFDSTVFLCIVASICATSIISFFFLNNYSGFDDERVSQDEKKELAKENTEVAEESQTQVSQESMLDSYWVGLFILMAVINMFFNGLMPSLQTYSCLPYGRRAFHLAVTLGTIANPVACLAGVWFKMAGGRYIAAMLVVSAGLITYITTTAVMSPTPPLYQETSGAVIIVIVWVVANALMSYSRMWIYSKAREGGTKPMRILGTIGQLGSALGSFTLFWVVNFGNFFEQAQDCPMPA